MDPGVVSIASLGTPDPDPRRSTRTRVEQRWRVVAVLPPTPAVDIVIQVHNEDRDLARSVRRLHAYLKHEFSFSARITIAGEAGPHSGLDTVRFPLDDVMGRRAAPQGIRCERPREGRPDAAS